MTLLKPIVIALSLLSVSSGLPQQEKLQADGFPVVLDAFDNPKTNALGYWHGVTDTNKFGHFTTTPQGSSLQVSTVDIDSSFTSALAEGCADWTALRDAYVHLVFSGSSKFTVSLQQHNRWCDDTKKPFPQTADSIEAARYALGNSDIYIPVSHFNIDLSKVNGIAIEGFWTPETTYLYRLELITKLPAGASIPPKLPSGTVHFSCKGDNQIVFGIDDGSPLLAPRTMQILREENIPATFFVQGSALVNKEDNFSAIYSAAAKQGHQIALHTFSHPHMEAVQSDAGIDMQMQKNVLAMSQELNMTSHYFRPPYGTLGARTRQSVSRFLSDAQIIMWTIDVKDWLYGSTDTKADQLQYKSFVSDLDAGGDIVVMHYLYESTVDQFRQMIQYAKFKGKQFVRADQCVGDPKAPESWGWKRSATAS